MNLWNLMLIPYEFVPMMVMNYANLLVAADLDSGQNWFGNG